MTLKKHYYYYATIFL